MKGWCRWCMCSRRPAFLGGIKGQEKNPFGFSRLLLGDDDTFLRVRNQHEVKPLFFAIHLTPQRFTKKKIMEFSEADLSYVPKNNEKVKLVVFLVPPKLTTYWNTKTRWFNSCPFHPLLGGHLTPWKGHLTIPIRSLWITRLVVFWFHPIWKICAFVIGNHFPYKCSSKSSKLEPLCPLCHSHRVGWMSLCLKLPPEVVDFLVIQSDLFGMVKWPFQRLSDLQPGDQKVTLNHLVVEKQKVMTSTSHGLTNRQAGAIHCNITWVEVSLKNWGTAPVKFFGFCLLEIHPRISS